MDEKFYKKSHTIHMRNYVYNFHFHLVWVTKYRKRIFITKKLVHVLAKILKYIANKEEIKIEAMKIMPDHIHLMLSFKPKLSGTNAVRALKGESALMLLKKYPNLKAKYNTKHLWSHSYYMGTVGDMSRATVRKYIADQYKNAHYRPK